MTDVSAATALVVTVNVAVVAPAATVTLAGAWAAAVLLLESVTAAPLFLNIECHYECHKTAF